VSRRPEAMPCGVPAKGRALWQAWLRLIDQVGGMAAWQWASCCEPKGRAIDG